MKNFITSLIFMTILSFNFSCAPKNVQVNNQNSVTNEPKVRELENKKENRKLEKLTKEKEEYSISPSGLPEKEKLYINVLDGWEFLKDAENSLEYRVLFRNTQDSKKEKNLLIISNNFSNESSSPDQLAFLTEQLAVNYFSIDQITDFRRSVISNINVYSAGAMVTSTKSLIGLLFFKKNEQVYIVFCEDKNDLKDCVKIISTIH